MNKSSPFRNTDQLAEKTLTKVEKLKPSSSCSYSYFGEMSKNASSQNSNEIEVSFSDDIRKASIHNLDIHSSSKSDQLENKGYEASSMVVTWRSGRRGSNAGMYYYIYVYQLY